MRKSLRSSVRAFTPLVGPFAVLFLLAFFVPTVLAAPSNPAGVTAQACTFSNTWTDGLTRWIFGVSGVLMLLALIGGGLQARSAQGGGGGGEHVSGAIGGLSGVAIILAAIGAIGLFAAFAIAAAGGTACP